MDSCVRNYLVSSIYFMGMTYKLKRGIFKYAIGQEVYFLTRSDNGSWPYLIKKGTIISRMLTETLTDEEESFVPEGSHKTVYRSVQVPEGTIQYKIYTAGNNGKHIIVYENFVFKGLKEVLKDEEALRFILDRIGFKDE